MAALLRQPPKQHKEMKLGKAKAKATSRTEGKKGRAK